LWILAAVHRKFDFGDWYTGIPLFLTSPRLQLCTPFLHLAASRTSAKFTRNSDAGSITSRRVVETGCKLEPLKTKERVIFHHFNAIFPSMPIPPALQTIQSNPFG
jgi:hypothetical protein